MTINRNTGMFDWAIPDPGPPEKVYNETNRLLAYIPHDMVGYYSGPDSYSRMREPGVQASWGGSVGYDPQGRAVMWQHYPIWGCPWTSSSYYWNTRGWTTETVREEYPLNDYNPPTLSDPLVAVHMRIIADIEEYVNWRDGFTGKFVRDISKGLSVYPNQRLVLEHREVHPQDNATTCPNGRMASLYYQLAQRGTVDMPDKFTDDEFLELMARLKDEGKLDSMGFIDTRFRELDAKRYALVRLAFDSDGPRVENAYKALKDKGFAL